MSAPVVDAQPLIDAIDTAVTAAGVVFGDGQKPAVDSGSPYVVAFFDPGTVEDRSLQSRDGWSTVLTAHCVGQSPESARFAVRKLRAAVLGLHLAEVGGRRVQMPEHLAGLPMQRDDDADPTLFIAIDEWRLRTSPA